MRRVGLYVRVSTDEQDTALQKRELAEYTAARGWGFRLYEDSGKSGTTPNRPMFKAMMADARARKLDLVICWRLDRLFRSLKDLILTLQELTELGVDFVSLKDNIDLTTSSGRLMMHLIGAFAEFEGAIIKERVKAGLDNARKRGTRLGRPRTRDEVGIVGLRDQGLSIRQIASKLGISKSTVHAVLKDAVRKSPLNSAKKA